MKKNFLKFAVVTVMFAFAACSSDDGGSKNNNGGSNGNTEECTSLVQAASSALAGFQSGSVTCEAALSAIEEAWDADCLSDQQALSMGQQLPCFDISNYN